MEQYADVVIDLEGNAIQGATVQIFAGAPNAWLQGDFTIPTKLYDSNGTQQDTVVTDARGAFAFQAPNGKYVLQVKVRGTIYAAIGPHTFYDPADDDERVTSSELAAPGGASLIGTPYGAVSAQLNITRLFRNSPEDFYFAGDVDWTEAFIRAVANIPNAGSGVISLSPGKNYQISRQVDIVNKRVVIDSANATVTAVANMNYLFYIEGENCELRNFSINKNPSVTVGTAAVFLKGLQHVVNNITSRDQKWPNFFHMRELKESKFLNMDVQLDVSGRTGNLFLADYCVNNTMANCFFGFFDSMIKGTNATHPTSGYSNEGMGLTNIQCVYGRKVIDYVRMTSLTVGSGCLFDFCETWGIFITNGHTLYVTPGFWCTSNDTDGFIGVGTGATFDNANVNNAFFGRNASVADTKAMSLPGTNSTVTGMKCLGGMNAGVVTRPATPISLWGNQIEAPGTALTNEGFQTGLWMPSLSFGGASVGLAYASGPAKYVKTGNRIDVEFYISLSAKGTSTGPAVVSGLPFTADPTSMLYVGVTGYLNGVTAAGSLSGYVSPNTQNIVLGYSGAAGWTALTDANFTNATEVSMSFSYLVP